jgi:cyanophycinase
MKWIKNVLALCVTASLAMGLAGCAASAKHAQPGALVIVGGGGTVEPIRVVVLPQASSVEKRGEEAAQMWRDSGAAKSSVVEFGDVAAARAAIAAADLVWIGGGDQSQFMKEAGDAGLLDFLRERHRSGVVFGGTSAGAAVMSPHMLTGNPEDAPEKLAPGSVEIVSGLGLFPGAIVDQHFVVRRRNNRLLSAVLTHPDHVGFGIDERTALIVTPQR